MNKYLEILLGLILAGSGAHGIWFFRDQVMVVIEGCVGIVLVLMAGAIIGWALLFEG